MTTDKTDVSRDVLLVRNIHGREFIEIDHPAVKARISLEGAHIVSCIPTGQKPLLWMSPVDPEQPGKPLRGGIPICWPWFSGERPGPAHGIARTSQWILSDSSSTPKEIRLSFELPESLVAEQLPDEKWGLRVSFVLGATLSVSLSTTNLGTQPQSLSQALHSYLPVSDIRSVRISGLEGAHYIDQLEGTSSNIQEGEVRFAGEVDRIYYGHSAPVTLKDGEDQMIVSRDGSRSVVVWNPWIDKGGRLSHFPAEGYLGMLCIEAANAGPDGRILKPGETHTLSTEIRHA